MPNAVVAAKTVAGRRVPPRATRAAPRESAIRRWVSPLVVAAVTFAAFLPTLRNQFVAWDDDKNFVDNPHFRGLGVDQLRWMWTTFHMGHYVPLSWMTLGLDYTIWGMNPVGYHLTNVVLHAANAVVVFYLARWLLETTCGPSSGSDRRIDVAAALSALLFAVHPLRVESVAWATERRDVLSGLFFFSSALLYATYVARSDRRRYWIALALFVLALLSKATSMSLPAVLLLLEVYPLRRLGGEQGWATPAARRVYAAVAPFGLLALAAAGLSIVALHPPSQLGVAAKLAVSAYSLMFYLAKTAAPFGLSPLYEMPQHIDPLALTFVGSEAAVVAIIVWAWSIRRRHPAITTALAVFLVVTLPLLGVVQNGPQIAADRYTYHAAPALAMIGGAAYVWLARRAEAWARAIGVLLVVALAALTARQTAAWRDSAALWTRVLEVDPQSSIGHSAMANVLYRENRVAEAMQHSELAVRLAPEYPEAVNGLGVGLAREGRVPEAIAQYERALALRPRFDEAETNLGVALSQQGQFEAAIQHYERALAINPDNSNAQVNWANALVRLNRIDEALPHYAAAVRIRADNADAESNWGAALAREQRYAEAIGHFQAALAIDPDHAEARRYLEVARRLLHDQR